MKRLIKQCELATIEGNPIALYKKNTTYYVLYDFGIMINLLSYSSLKLAIADFMERIKNDYRIKRGYEYYITDYAWTLIRQYYNVIKSDEQSRCNVSTRQCGGRAQTAT